MEFAVRWAYFSAAENNAPDPKWIWVHTPLLVYRLCLKGRITHARIKQSAEERESLKRMGRLPGAAQNIDSGGAGTLNFPSYSICFCGKEEEKKKTT